MALAVEKPAAQLDFISRPYGRWNYTELDNDYPELVDEVRQLLEIDEIKSSSERNERVQAARMYTTSYKLADAVQKSPNRNEESQVSTPEWVSKGKMQSMERMPQLNRSEHNSESPCKARYALPQKRGHLQFSESTPEYLHQSKYQSPFVGQTTDNKDFNGIHTTLPSYSPTPKSLLNTVYRSKTPSTGYSKSYLSDTLPEDCSPRQERARSRSLSLARNSSSNAVKPMLHHSLADSIEDRLSSTWKSRQRSFSNSVDTKRDWIDSPFQADYWACALPNCKPPSPDRQSPHWNPDKEYQDLLDYTYPLNSKLLRSREKSNDYISPEPFLHDSGIGLSSFSASPDHTILSLNTSWDAAQHARATNSILSGKVAISPQQSCTNLSSSAGYLKMDYDRHHAPAGTVSLDKSSDSTSGIDVSADFKIPFYNCALSSSLSSSSVDESEWSSKEDHPSMSKLRRNFSFIPTTNVLQLKKVWDNDDEYLSLPPRLKELENLAQQLTDLSLTVQESGYDNEERDLLATPLNQKHAERIDGKETGCISEDDSEDTPEYRFTFCEPHNSNIKKIVQCQGDAENGLTKLSSLKFMLEGISASNSTTDGWQQGKDRITDDGSLVQCIKIFCHKLEDLIQWLYKVSNMTEKWVPPKPDVESIQSALQLYLKFKKDVIEHQTVADDVIKMGEILLRCMTSNLPVLKDALALIVKHSEELEQHGQRLYASVLGAMDTITKSGDH